VRRPRDRRPVRRPCRALPAVVTALGFVLAQAGAEGLAAQGSAPTAGDEVPGASLPVREVVLANGMRVLILPRAGAPTVAFVVQYGVGSVNESLGNTGIAHLLEHLLFKGTTTVGTQDHAAERPLFLRMDAAHDTLLQARGRPAPDSATVARLQARIRALEDSARAFVVSNDLDRILTRQGARGLNATTSTESTIYYVQLPANRAELWFALEADRMRNPVFREFYAERDVVLEERRMRVEDSPGGRLYEAHLAAAYRMHPYGVPVIGWMSDIESLSRAQVEAYYRRFYSPSNAVVAIVGSVDPDQVEGWAHRYLGSVPAGERPPPVLAREPPQRGERRVEVEADAEPLLRIGWHVPELTHADAPALSVLAALLTGGRTTRLYRSIVLEARAAHLRLRQHRPWGAAPAALPDRRRAAGSAHVSRAGGAHLRRAGSTGRGPSVCSGDRAHTGTARGRRSAAAGVGSRAGVPARRLGVALGRLAGDLPVERPAARGGARRRPARGAPLPHRLQPDRVHAGAPARATLGWRSVKPGARRLAALLLLPAAVSAACARVPAPAAPEPTGRQAALALEFPPLAFEPPQPELRTLPGGVEVLHLEDRSLPLVTVLALFRGGYGRFPRSDYAAGLALPSLLRSGGTRTLPPDSVDLLLELTSLQTSFGSSGGSFTSSVNTLTRGLSDALALWGDMLRDAALRLGARGGLAGTGAGERAAATHGRPRAPGSEHLQPSHVRGPPGRMGDVGGRPGPRRPGSSDRLERSAPPRSSARRNLVLGVSR
jgi:predicted Zn-dependent peptidase